MVKIVRKCHFSKSFSTQYKHYYKLFNYPWLTYFKLIIGAKDQNLLTVYKMRCLYPVTPGKADILLTYSLVMVTSSNCAHENLVPHNEAIGRLAKPTMKVECPFSN